MLQWGKRDNETTTLPTRDQYHMGVRTLGCGDSHTVVLLEDGSLVHSGRGQLDSAAAVRLSAGEDVMDVQCGGGHSVALVSHGKILTWGDNSNGQLGRGEEGDGNDLIPRPVEIKMEIVQVSCGSRHTLALAQNSYVYSWGHNDRHQLGHSPSSLSVSSPSSVSSLQWLPIAAVAAGGAHSFAVTQAGKVLGWGKNSSGQVGVGSLDDVTTPTLLASLNSQVVRAVVCGGDHTVALTEDGGVFSFGSNEHGQLGHSPSSSHCLVPTKVFELMGSVVTQVACGRAHTLVLVQSSSRVYGFGAGSNGQLGTGSLLSHKLPVLVVGNWAPPSSLTDPEDMEIDGMVNTERHVVKTIYAGGDRSFAVLALPGQHTAESVTDMRSKRWPHPLFINHSLARQMLDFLSLQQAMYSMGNTQVQHNTKELFRLAFSSVSLLNGSFIKCDCPGPLEQHSDFDIDDAIATISLVTQRLGPSIAVDCFVYALSAAPPKGSPTVPEGLRVFLLALYHPILDSFPTNLTLLGPLFNRFNTLSGLAKEIIGNWLFNSPTASVQSIVLRIKRVIMNMFETGYKLLQKEPKKPPGPMTVDHFLSQQHGQVLKGGLEFLKWLHTLNRMFGETLNHDLFYINELHGKYVNIVEDYVLLRQNRTDRIVYMRYPFLMNAACKSSLISIDGRFRMNDAIVSATVTNMFSRGSAQDHSPSALVLNVRRSHLLQDTVTVLPHHSHADYKKPLHVVFEGEEGMDDGGIKKEYFMLLIKELLNPMFGMFYEDEESHLIWFRDQATILDESDTKHFHLIGLICGLAAYNNVIIDLPFPLVLYKKLLRRKPALPDLTELKPSVGRHLSAILACDQTHFSESYQDLTFSIVRHHYGSVLTVPLIPDGEKTAVTWDRRSEYVLVYLKYELTDSVQEPYKAFSEGFRLAFDSFLFDSLHPKELISLMVGCVNFNFNDLEKHTHYENGYSPTHPVIVMFWTVFRILSDSTKKQLFVFWTGSNRIPVAGLASMNMIIQKMDGGSQCQRLPVAHTCYNILDLPPYTSQLLMKEKLLQAVNFTEGFGIV